MAVTKINLTGIHKMDITLPGTTTATIASPGVVSLVNVGAGGSGTVTSVALTVPSRMTVAGSPIVSTGTLAVTDNPETANTVFAGPASGASAVPGFRALVAADVPAQIVSSLTTTGTSGAATLAGGVLNVPQYVAGSAGASTNYYTAADVPPATANAMDDEFTGTTLAAKWTQVSTGLPTLTFFGSSQMQAFQPKNNGDQISAIYQPLPATPYTVVLKMVLPSVNENYHYAGLSVRDSASGKFVKGHFATQGWTVAVQNFANPTTISIGVGSATTVGYFPGFTCNWWMTEPTSASHTR